MKDGKSGNRQDNKRVNGQFGNQVKRYGQQSDNRKTIPDRAGNRGSEHRRDNRNIVGDAGHKIAGFFPLKKGQRQVLHMTVKPISQTHDNALANVV